MRIDDLPGELLMWVLIVSELLIFATGISVLSVLRLRDPDGFAAAQALLDGRLAAANTVILVSSGYAAARAERAARLGRTGPARLALLLAALGGIGFLALKAVEYIGDAARGITMEGSPFFTFYYLLTGFHAAHVIAGVVLLLLVALRARPEPVQAGAMFWHMVDLVWVLILPPIYLLG